MKKSRREKELPPVFRTAEWDDADRNGPEERFIALFQPEMRYICTRMQCWRQCRLPRCRRGRCCTGSHKQNSFHRNFPPCISSTDLHQGWLREHRIYEDELRTAYPAFWRDDDD